MNYKGILFSWETHEKYFWFSNKYGKPLHILFLDVVLWWNILLFIYYVAQILSENHFCIDKVHQEIQQPVFFLVFVSSNFDSSVQQNVIPRALKKDKKS